MASAEFPNIAGMSSPRSTEHGGTPSLLVSARHDGFLAWHAPALRSTETSAADLGSAPNSGIACETIWLCASGDPRGRQNCFGRVHGIPAKGRAGAAAVVRARDLNISFEAWWVESR